jgi:hypothetical protein
LPDDLREATGWVEVTDAQEALDPRVAAAGKILLESDGKIFRAYPDAASAHPWLAKLRPDDRYQMLITSKQLFDMLREGLVEAEKLYDETIGRSGGRIAAQLALEVVNDFVRHSMPGVVTPLLVLSQALKELDGGVTPPILERAKVHSRPVSTAMERLREHAAIAAELLIRSGLKSPLACDYVAKRLGKMGYRLKGRPDRQVITCNTVKGWHKQYCKKGHQNTWSCWLLESLGRDSRPSNLSADELRKGAERVLEEELGWMRPPPQRGNFEKP